MAYTVLARRYRSESFDDLVGQEAIAQTLKNAIVSNRVAHAYLFTGTRGVGKTSMARILAKALNCLATDGPTASPCCQCESCQAISVGTDIDVIEIDGASNNSVDNVREMRQSVIYAPARSRFKIYIIDEVHMLSSGAFNALLKTLEEPPDHVKFIFATTEANKILPTILSRCQRFDFRNINIDDIAAHLAEVLKSEGVAANDAVVRRVARLANGSMRDGLSLLDQLLSMAGGELKMEMLDELLGTPGNEQVVKLVGAMAEGDVGKALLELDAIVTGGFVLEQVVDGLQSYFRDLMILKNCGGDTELVDIVESERRQQALDQAGKFDDAALVYNITIMEELKRTLKVSGSGRSLVEAAIVRLTKSERFSNTKTLIELLRSLPAGGGVETGRTVSSGASAGARIAASGDRSGMKPPRGEWQGSPKPKGASMTVEAPKKDVEPAMSVSADMSLDELRQNWSQLVAKTGLFKQFLMNSYVKSWENQCLTISFESQNVQLGKAMLLVPDHKTRLEKGFSKLFQCPVKVIVDMPVGENGDDQGEGGQMTAPGARPSRRQNESAANDKKVQQVIETLDGRIASIERIVDPESK